MLLEFLLLLVVVEFADKPLLHSLFDDSRFDNRFILLNSFELYSSVELPLPLFADDRYEPPIVLGLRDCNGTRRVEPDAAAPDSFDARCALLIVLFLDVDVDAAVVGAAGAGTRSSTW